MYNCIVYIAGPYKSFDRNKLKQNVRIAERVSNMFWRLGFPNICPHKNSFMGEAPEECFANGYLHIVKRCDAVCLLPHWEQSDGTIMELQAIHKMDKLVFEWDRLHVAIKILQNKFVWENEPASKPTDEQVVELVAWVVSANPPFASEEETPLRGVLDLLEGL